MDPTDRPLRGHRAPILISLGSRPNPKSLSDFLVHRFKRIDVLVDDRGRVAAENDVQRGSRVALNCRTSGPTNLDLRVRVVREVPAPVTRGARVLQHDGRRARGTIRIEQYRLGGIDRLLIIGGRWHAVRTRQHRGCDLGKCGSQ